MLSYSAFQIKSGDTFGFFPHERTAMQGQFLLNKLQGMEKKKPFSVLTGSMTKRDNLKLQASEELYWPVTSMSRSHTQTNSAICSPRQLPYNFEIRNNKFHTCHMDGSQHIKQTSLLATAADFLNYKLLN